MEPFLGEIIMFGGNFAPRSWAFCDGQLLAISSNSALFSILGTTFGGDGRTTFGLPDMKSRVPVHEGTGAGLQTWRLGEKSGVDQVTLSSLQMPSHTHTAALHAESTPGSSNNPTNNLIGGGGSKFSTPNPAANVVMNAGSVINANTGGNQPHTNIQPSLCVNFIICTAGLFPSRN